ncbi:MAG: PQQ-dependent sugar dehydrogenase [Nitrosopumilus sp.]|nr:PQQ-dependent sugar dehydrogenase [Nitrosopumilus sp.]
MLILFFIIPVAYAQDYPEYGVRVETVADNLSIPWSIDFAPDGRIFFTERTGNLRIIQNDHLLEPIMSLNVAGGEGGLLGIALDPDFEKNHYVYLYFTYNELFDTKNKVVRYIESNNSLKEDKVLLEPFAGASYHDGGRLKFGPDGKLYITTGDAGNPDMAQDENSTVGKILRINSDGTIPKDNPYGTAVYSIGHRNPQGIDWDENGKMFATEHGPSGWRGVAHDEINEIIPGGNYGWPEIIGDETKQNMINPILHSGDDTWAPSGATFYYGENISQWTGKFFVATLRGEHLHMISFDQNKISSHKKLFFGEFGRLRDVVESPDGYLYLLTSNQDGRGNPDVDDDKILRIVSISNINSFEECIKAGNSIMESHPRQCRTYDGKRFVEEISKIPDWVRNIAKWWSLRQISDQDFALGLEYLIKQDIIIIKKETTSETNSELQLPLWLRKNIGWWSEGLLSDDEFSKDIQWMIDNRFIKI